jgi:hypothetical protein
MAFAEGLQPAAGVTVAGLRGMPLTEMASLDPALLGGVIGRVLPSCSVSALSTSAFQSRL